MCSAPIQHQLPGLSLYESFDLVSQGKAIAELTDDAPSIVTQTTFAFDPRSIRTILTAEQGQTLNTGKLLLSLEPFSSAQLLPTPALQNIHFSMRDLATPEMFTTLGYDKAIGLARQTFIEKLFDGLFSETLPQLQSRMQHLLDLTLSLEGDSLCVGHAFFLKILEIYVNTPEAFHDRIAFIHAFEPHRRPYEPLEGFSVPKPS